MSTAVLDDVVAIPEAPIRTPRKRWTRFILPVFTIAMIVYLAFPVLVMIVYSFNIIPNTGESERQTTDFHCCTVVHWQEILKVPELNHALLISLSVAFPAALFATTGTRPWWPPRMPDRTPYRARRGCSEDTTMAHRSGSRRVPRAVAPNEVRCAAIEVRPVPRSDV